MKVYNYHPDTLIYVGESEADESPLEPGVFLIPAHATDIKPTLKSKEGFDIAFVDGQWVHREIPPEPEPEDPDANTPLDMKAWINRDLIRRQLQAEADPLFFKWQRGECTEQQWRDAIAAVRARPLRFPEAEGVEPAVLPIGGPGGPLPVN